MIMNYTVPNAKENILAGTKIHTLRRDRVLRWKPGFDIHHATGSRSKDYNCFLINKCRSVQQVLIILLKNLDDTEYISVTIDRRRLSRDEVAQFAVNDGFKDEQDLIYWFFKKEPGVDMWAGRCIHWTRLKY